MLNNIREVGYIESFFTGVAKLRGLDHALINETLTDSKGVPQAMVVGFDKNFVDAIFFNEGYHVEDPIFSSGETFNIPVTDSYLGRVVNGIGIPIDGKPRIKGTNLPVFVESPGIMARVPIKRPFITGIKAIDATLPLGRGQRELIIGDRKLGKTTIATDIVLNQAESYPKVYCIYVICGRKDNEVDKLIDIFKKSGALRYSVIVAAPASTSLAEQYLAPQVGTVIAEYFRNSGRDALIIYDDLSAHAKVARSISLLLKRAPGREVYPGDIFSLHSSLLERSSQLTAKRGGGSLTALPIVETQEGDIASYIATNLISITDGQIYLDRGFYDKGYLPAIDIGLSVSRIGSQAQPPLLKESTKDLRLSLAQNRELEKLTDLENNLSGEAQSRIKRGKIILELLKQEKHSNITWQEQSLLYYTISLGKFDNLSETDLSSVKKYFFDFIKSKRKLLMGKIEKEIPLIQMKEEVADAAESFLKQFGEEKYESIPNTKI